MPTNMKHTTEGHTFEREVDFIDVSTFNGMELDPDWTHVDKQGHIITQHSKAWYVDEIWWCAEDNENHEAGHWVCPICAEAVKPGERPGKKFIPGLVHYKIDGVEVTEDEWHRAYERYAP